MKKQTVFKTKSAHKNRLFIRRPLKEARTIREICSKLSRRSRKMSLPDRIKIRKTINSLLKNAEILEGKGI